MYEFRINDNESYHASTARCPKCRKSYTTLRAMKNHAASHTETKVPAPAAPVPAPQKTVVCSVCGDKFSEVRKDNCIRKIMFLFYL